MRKVSFFLRQYRDGSSHNCCGCSKRSSWNRQTSHNTKYRSKLREYACSAGSALPSLAPCATSIFEPQFFSERAATIRPASSAEDRLKITVLIDNANEHYQSPNNPLDSAAARNDQRKSALAALVEEAAGAAAALQEQAVSLVQIVRVFQLDDKAAVSNAHLQSARGLALAARSHSRIGRISRICQISRIGRIRVAL
jgi:hypothetical protein